MKVLITGGAGFIGSNLARFLLAKGCEVVVFDNFATGKLQNLAGIREQITLVEGDLRDVIAVERVVAGVDAISHHGALGSVPGSIANPVACHEVNVNGTLNILEAMRKTGVKRIVFAASSSAYGRHPASFKHESLIPDPISPYAASKLAGEVYLQTYAAAYGLEAVSLRYFNVFGPWQDPNGAYAAVIPRFVSALLRGERPIIYGDGEQTRDFLYVTNVCHANWLGLKTPGQNCDGRPLNIGCNQATSLNRILALLQSLLGTRLDAIYEPERRGDVRHSLADIQQAKAKIDYQPQVLFEEGLNQAIGWYQANLS